MNWRKLIVILAIPASLIMLGSCGENTGADNAATTAPARELDWAVTGTGVSGLGQAPDGIYRIMRIPEAAKDTEGLELWKWNGDTITQVGTTIVPGAFLSLSYPCVLPGNRYLACFTPRKSGALRPLVIATIPENKKCEEKLLPQGWACEGTGVSRNGKYVAFFCPECIINPASDKPEKNGEYYRYRVGVSETTSLDIQWICELSIDSPAASVRTIAVSNDGQYVALGGWGDGGVTVIVASEKRVLWQGRPPGVVSLGYVAFSSDGVTLYALDSGGGYVFVHDTKDGKIRSRWCASESGNPEYGHRISCMAVSPDDAWVAAGTGPEGLVYVYNTKAPGQPVVFTHGLGTTLTVSFSPDSKHLASVAGGKIKVWNIGGKSVNPTPSSKPG